MVNERMAIMELKIERNASVLNLMVNTTKSQVDTLGNEFKSQAIAISATVNQQLTAIQASIGVLVAKSQAQEQKQSEIVQYLQLMSTFNPMCPDYSFESTESAVYEVFWQSKLILTK